MNQIIKFFKQSRKVFSVVLFFALITITTPVALGTTEVKLIEINTGLTATAGGGYGDMKNIPKDIPTTIGVVVGAMLAFVGIVFLILMIYGGVVWMFAQGNEQEVTKAKGLIFSAIIGLIIVLGAYAITAYVGSVVGQ